MTDPDIVQGDEIEIKADWAQKTSTVFWRPIGVHDWQATIFDVQDVGQGGRDHALHVVDAWLDMRG